MRLLLGALVILTTLTASGQQFLPEVPQICLSLQIGPSHGSGFLYQKDDELYLITAKHVLYRTDTNFFTTNSTIHDTNLAAALIFPLGTTNLVTLKIDLGTAKNRGHLYVSEKRDIAAIKWGFGKTNEVYLYDFVRLNLPNPKPTNSLGIVHHGYTPKFEAIEAATDIYMVGFPSDIGIFSQQVEPQQPLFAKGIVAGKNYTTRRVIINTASYGGNSGGPVWGKKQVGINGYEFFIIGAVVEWIPAVNKVSGGKMVLQNSGYAVVEPMDSVLEILPK